MLIDLASYDWEQAFDVAAADVRRAHPKRHVEVHPFTRADVAVVYAKSEGENDADPWLMIGALHDGRLFFLSAWCDYTGWDCQAGGTFVVAEDYQTLIKYGLTEDEASRLVSRPRDPDA